MTDADIARKQSGLEATSELLLTKRHRLRSLQRKVAALAEGAGVRRTSSLERWVGGQDVGITEEHRRGRGR